MSNKKPKFKVGDEVICIDNPNRKLKGIDNDGYGHGWKEGLKFKIEGISMEERILWGGLKGNGVYEDCVQLVSEDIQRKLE